MSEKLIILPEDKAYALERIKVLEREILELGEEFNIALRQSNETWHDNAAFDAARDKQSVLAAELQTLRETLRNARTGLPKVKKGVATYGNTVTIASEGRSMTYKLAGDWSPFAGKTMEGMFTISAQSPIGKSLLGARTGDTVILPPRNKQAVVAKVVA